MPSLQSVLLSAHPGFIEGCLLLNNLAIDPEEYKSLTMAAINKKKYNSSADLSKERATLEFLERACKGANPAPDSEEIAAGLSSITTLSDEAIEIFLRCRAEKNASEIISDLPQNGKLMDLQWRLGLAVESNSGKNLNSIYVTMSFKVLDSHNRETVHTLELPYQKFQEFVGTIRDATTAMQAL